MTINFILFYKTITKRIPNIRVKDGKTTKFFLQSVTQMPNLLSQLLINSDDWLCVI